MSAHSPHSECVSVFQVEYQLHMPAAMRTISASETRADVGMDVCERPGVLSDANAAAVKTVRSATALVTKSA